MIFIRPYCLLLLLPIFLIAIYLWRRPQAQLDWQKVCDLALFKFFIQNKTNRAFWMTYFPFIASLLLLTIALAGPSWHRLPMPVGQIQKPVVILFDLSTTMLLDDVSPTRLERTKTLIQDSLKAHPEMQFGLVVFSGMPFVTTPITSDIDNILTFLPLLSPDILPVGGYDFDKALDKAEGLIHQSGFDTGKILVFSSQSEDQNLIKKFSKKWDIKWMWIAPKQDFLKYHRDVNIWLSSWHFLSSHYKHSKLEVIEWKDEGRIFLFLAMLPLVLVFRKGWFLRLWV